MPHRQPLALVCIALPLAALLSLGCGIFMLPVAGPKAALHNAQRIKFTLKVVGDDGKLLDGVSATFRRHKDGVTIFGEFDESQPPEQQLVNGEFHYKSVGAYAVDVDLEKPGYQRVRLVCGNEPGVPMEATFWNFPMPAATPIDVKQHPNIVVQMTRKSADTQPANPPGQAPPPPAGPSYPTTH